MDNIQLLEMINKIPQIQNFLGIFPINQIPKPSAKNYSFIANTDPSHLPGRHWISVYSNGQVFYFDSLAQSVPKQIATNFKIRHKLTKPVQSNISVNCAYYVTIFLYLINIGCTFDEIYHFLNSISDLYVKNFCKQLIKS